MISREKATNIAASTSKIGQSTQNTMQKNKRELILELDKGKFLYVSCMNFKMQPNETTVW